VPLKVLEEGMPGGARDKIASNVTDEVK